MLIAVDRSGNTVRASLAHRGTSYYCPECKNKVFVKNSKGNSRRPHFVHLYNISRNGDCPLYDGNIIQKGVQKRRMDRIQEVLIEEPVSVQQVDPLAGISAKASELAEEARRIWYLDDKQTEKLAAMMQLTAIWRANQIRFEEILGKK